MNEPLNTPAKVLGACFITGLVLCILKATRVIDWSWLVVTAPLWGPFALLFAALCVLAVLLIFARALKWIAERLKGL